MFLEKKFIFVGELSQKMGIHMANFSMLRKRFEDEDDFYTITKLGGYSFINSKSRKIPNNILAGIASNTFTDMSDKLPCPFVRSEYDLQEGELFESEMVLEKVTIADKDFYVFAPKIVKLMKNKIGYVLDEEEMNRCTANGHIEGHIYLDQDRYFTWY